MAEVTTGTWLISILTAEQVGDNNFEGDVISVSRDRGFVGRAEVNSFLWLRVSEVPTIVLNEFGIPHTDGSSRFSIPFTKISEIATSIGTTFDEVAARDPNVAEQIHVTFNATTGINEVTGTPIVGLNVFFDKGPRGFIV